MKHLHLIVIALISHLGFAQFGNQQIISTEAIAPYSVISADVDGDGDNDVLTAAFGNTTVAWFDNLDGLGSFSSINVIGNSLNGTRYLNTADFDNDGDLDVVATAGADDIVVWFENLDGQGAFGSSNLLGTVPNPRDVISFDVDADGDQDVVAPSSSTGLIIWFENLNGLGGFGSGTTLISGVSAPRVIDVGDLDGDGDLDLVATSNGNQKVLWFENLDGQGDYGSVVEVSSDSPGVLSVVVVDMDGDGDLDILSGQTVGSYIDWFENLDGLGTFGPKRSIGPNEQGVTEVFATDLDNDGDQDVLASSLEGDAVSWYENLDGLGNFGEQKNVTNLVDNAFSVFAADLNGDGLDDVLSASIADSKVAWYSNEILGVDESLMGLVNIYPNPMTTQLHIDLPAEVTILKASLYDLLGKKMDIELVSETINVSSLSDGIYILQLDTTAGTLTQKLIKN